MNLESHAMTAETPAARAVPVSLEVQRTVEAAFRHYESRLFHAALRITHNEDDAWDAVQEGMVNALRNAECQWPTETDPLWPTETDPPWGCFSALTA